jgi:hypothetical protein
MSRSASITVNRPRQQIERLWAGGHHPPATFSDAPGDRGTEIRVAVEEAGPVAKLGEVVQKLAEAGPRAKAMDELRRFKALVETGVVPRSEGAPQGEAAERKLKRRPAQPLSDDELERAGSR